MLAVPPMGTTGPATLPLNALLLEEQHQGPVLHHLESAVSSPSHVVEAAVLIIPMPSSVLTPLAVMMTHVPTHSAEPIQMFVN